MTYQSMMTLYANKVRAYDMTQCIHATCDILTTLELHEHTSAYATQLLCELDAVRDQRRKLQGLTKAQRIALHGADQLLNTL
jgi:hypothetical protein